MSRSDDARASERIGAFVERHPDASAPVVLGRLRVDPADGDDRRLVEDVLAGHEDSPGSNGKDGPLVADGGRDADPARSMATCSAGSVLTAGRSRPPHRRLPRTAPRPAGARESTRRRWRSRHGPAPAQERGTRRPRNALGARSCRSVRRRPGRRIQARRCRRVSCCLFPRGSGVGCARTRRAPHEHAR